jgi:hypothetical protein
MMSNDKLYIKKGFFFMVELIRIHYGGSPVLSALLAEELLPSVFRRVLKITKNDYQLRYLCLSVYLSVRPSVRVE